MRRCKGFGDGFGGRDLVTTVPRQHEPSLAILGEAERLRLIVGNFAPQTALRRCDLHSYSLLLETFILTEIL